MRLLAPLSGSTMHSTRSHAALTARTHLSRPLRPGQRSCPIFCFSKGGQEPATAERGRPAAWRFRQTAGNIVAFRGARPPRQQGSRQAEVAQPSRTRKHPVQGAPQAPDTPAARVLDRRDAALQQPGAATQQQRSSSSRAQRAAAPSPPQPPAFVNKAWPWLHSTHGAGVHKPAGLVLASAWLLTTVCHLAGVCPEQNASTALMGAAVGGLHAVLNRAGMRRFWRAPQTQLTIVLTGGGRGIGKALARECLRAGDKVLLTSRTPAGARQAIAELREEVAPCVHVHGVDCDVSSPASVARLAATAEAVLGEVDVWINNAGCSGTFQPFVNARPEQLQAVVQTNLLGCMLCTRAAMRLMSRQPRGGHIFNMDGAGADGRATSQYAAYGATKAGIVQLARSLKLEAAQLDRPVGVHTISPGMVLTGLLLAGASFANKQVFNILCEQPETVAAFLVPRIRTVVARSTTSAYIKYLTPARALSKFLTAPLRAGRYFDLQGHPTYLPERERIFGQQAKQTERLANQAAQRNRVLGLSYSLSMAASFLIISADAYWGHGMHTS